MVQEFADLLPAPFFTSHWTHESANIIGSQGNMMVGNMLNSNKLRRFFLSHDMQITCLSYVDQIIYS